MPAEHPQGNLPQVLHEMEAIGHLHGGQCALASTIRVLGAAVAADHLDTGMVSQPGGERGRAAIEEQINHALTFEIHEDRPIGPPAPEREVVDAQHPRRGRVCEGDRTHVPDQSVPGSHDLQRAQEARAGAAAEGKRNVREPTGQPLGAAGVGSDDTRQSLREDPPRARQRVTEEASHSEPYPHWNALPGKIGQESRVAGMDACRLVTAPGTASRLARRTHRQGDRFGVGGKTEYVQPVGIGQDGEA
jgi:hypothetical protein